MYSTQGAKVEKPCWLDLCFLSIWGTVGIAKESCWSFIRLEELVWQTVLFGLEPSSPMPAEDSIEREVSSYLLRCGSVGGSTEVVFYKIIV